MFWLLMLRREGKSKDLYSIAQHCMAYDSDDRSIDRLF